MAKREFKPKVIRHPRIPLSEDEKKARLADLMPSPNLNEPFKTRYTMNRDEHIESSASYGPFTKTIVRPWPSNPSLRSFYDSKIWMRSKTKRHKTPNPYTHLVGRVIKNSPPSHQPDAVNSGAGNIAYSGRSGADTAALNKARSNFVTKVRDSSTASLAVTVAEWGQAQKMIVHRAGQIIAGLKAAKRLDIKGIETALKAGKVLETSRYRATEKFRDKVDRNKRREAPKAASNLWLEYHFGWEPLVKDIYEAVKVLSSNPPAQAVVGFGKYHELFGSSGSPQPYVAWTYSDYIAKARIQADVYVSNPNLALANQLGIVNPATVAWELVPFSFLVDWFIPVGKLLDSWTDLLGYSLQYPFTTTTRNVQSRYIYRQDSETNISDSVGWYHSRVLGIPAYKLRTVPFKGFSVARGATAISLVIQQFLSIKK